MRKHFWQIINYIKPYTSNLIVHLLFTVLGVLFSVVSLVIIIPFLEILFDKTPLVYQAPNFSLSVAYLQNYFYYYLSHIISTYGKPEALLFVCISVVSIITLKNTFIYAAAYVMATIRNGVVRDIRNTLFGKLLYLPLSYFTQQRKGDIITRLTADVQEIEYSIMSVISVSFREPLTIIAYLLVMLFISPALTLFVLLVLPITGLIIGRIGKSLKKKSHLVQSKLGQLISILEESLNGLRIIKGFNAQTQQTQKFARYNEQHYQLTRNLLRRRDLSSPLSETLSIGVVALVLYVGGNMVLTDAIALKAESFIVFIAIFSQILPPAKKVATAYYNIQKGLASVERINRILQEKSAVNSGLPTTSHTNFVHNIVFDDVSFAYEADKMVLQNINLQVNKGQIVALVGASGAGKSTLADLLPRFYAPTQGQIRIDHQNIQTLALHDLRQLIGIVTQQAFLFNDSVYNNITFGIHKQVSEEEVIAAAKIANAHHFISQLSNGYTTNIGDGGNKLSGGERQRLTIARAVLKNPPILILDEATSALDAESERLVQDALLKLMQNRTCLIIAHRLSTVQFAHQIVVLDKGQIKERGTHKQLLAQNGLYKRLVDLQALQ